MMHSNWTIEVSKSDLLNALVENREKHKKEYEEVYAAYQEKARDLVAEAGESLSEMAASPEDLTRNRIHAAVKDIRSLVEPENHTRDYDKVISMLRWETREVITLTQVDYDRFINNNWDWRMQFAATSAMYGVGVKEGE